MRAWVICSWQALGFHCTGACGQGDGAFRMALTCDLQPEVGQDTEETVSIISFTDAQIFNILVPHL